MKKKGEKKKVDKKGGRKKRVNARGGVCKKWECAKNGGVQKMEVCKKWRV